MKLIVETQESQYKKIIEQFIGFHNPCLHINAESVLEAVMKEIIASQNLRYGPAPSIESQYFIREIVRKSIKLDKPIPFLVPSGPKKTETGESIDIAELSVITIINDLNERIKTHYKPGTDVVIRLEDLTGFELEPDFVHDIEKYCYDFSNLVSIMGFTQIHPMLESTMTGANSFSRLVNEYVPLFNTYLLNTRSVPDELKQNDEVYKQLAALGWVGIISTEQRTQYFLKYAKLYPGISFEETVLLMSKYFACSLARKILGMKGDLQDWKETGFVEMSFLPPVEGYNHTARIYYRNVELNNSKRHIAYWRAKGFLKIGNDNSIRKSLVTWAEAKEMAFYYGSAILQDGDKEVTIKTDFVLE